MMKALHSKQTTDQTEETSKAFTECATEAKASSSERDEDAFNVPAEYVSCHAFSSTDDDSSTCWLPQSQTAQHSRGASSRIFYGHVTSFEPHPEYDSLVRLKKYEVQKRVPFQDRLPAQVLPRKINPDRCTQDEDKTKTDNEARHK